MRSGDTRDRRSRAATTGAIRSTGPGCPSITGAYAAKRIDPTQLAAIEADPNCFAFQSVFPGGFRPQFGGDIADYSIALGLRGETPGGTTYDISAVVGSHEIDFTLADTVNPQLAMFEARIPTFYQLGGQREQDVTVNLDFTRHVDVDEIEGALTDGRLVDVLLLSPADPLLSGIAQPLKEESSFSFGVGAVMSASRLRVTADFYRIEIDDRISIVNGGSIDCLLLDREGLIGAGGCDEAVANRAGELAAIKNGLRASVPAIHSIATVDWFANDFDTTSQGIDVVATWPAELFGGSTLFTLALNHNTTEIDRISPDSPLGGADNLHGLRIEQGTPELRVSLSANHQTGPLSVLARVRHYGGHTDIHAIDWHVQEMGGQTLVDLEIAYDVTDSVAVAAGADNLLNAEADRLGLDWTGDASSFGIMFPESAPFDTNGGFYYAKVVFAR